MDQLSLEDQLRCMILKNSGSPDGSLPPLAQQQGKDPLLAQGTSQQHPHPHLRGVHHPSHSQPRTHLNPTGSPYVTRPGHRYGQGNKGPGHAFSSQAFSQQLLPGVVPPHIGSDYIPPHMYNRSNGWHQLGESLYRPTQPWQNQYNSHVYPPAPAPSARSRMAGPPHEFQHAASSPPLFQTLHGPNPERQTNGLDHSGPGRRYQERHRRLPEQLEIQCRYMERLAAVEIPKLAMAATELKEKQAFVLRIQELCQNILIAASGLPAIEFKCFGSIETGFATKGSDIDLAVVTKNSQDTEMAQEVGPRVLEKIFLDHGFGARLLTNARVPIIKICEKPPEELLANLRAKRQEWDDLSVDERNALMEGGKSTPDKDNIDDDDADPIPGDNMSSPTDKNPLDPERKKASKPNVNGNDTVHTNGPREDENRTIPPRTGSQDQGSQMEGPLAVQQRHRRPKMPWLRDKATGPLDFPKEGVGIQCDVNFAGHLGIYNTRLLHCYAISDQRIRDMVIFVKAWAKIRKINSPYSGTLSSYGYALMVLHYLIRVPEYPVTPDLQSPRIPATSGPPPELVDVVCHGNAVKFLADEDYILQMVRAGQWTQNQQPLGTLLRGFFRYYGASGLPDRAGTFHWTRDVITFGQRSPREWMVTKEELGWTKARLEKSSKNKEVRHRYLICIQDPFELDHNVGRTVNHPGICAIREEFRRAWHIILDEGIDRPHQSLFATVDEDPPPPQFIRGGQQQQQQKHNTNSRPIVGSRDKTGDAQQPSLPRGEQQGNCAKPSPPSSVGDRSAV